MLAKKKSFSWVKKFTSVESFNRNRLIWYTRVMQSVKCLEERRYLGSSHRTEPNEQPQRQSMAFLIESVNKNIVYYICMPLAVFIQWNNQYIYRSGVWNNRKAACWISYPTIKQIRLFFFQIHQHLFKFIF